MPKPAVKKFCTLQVRCEGTPMRLNDRHVVCFACREYLEKKAKALEPKQLRGARG